MGQTASSTNNVTNQLEGYLKQLQETYTAFNNNDVQKLGTFLDRTGVNDDKLKTFIINRHKELLTALNQTDGAMDDSKIRSVFEGEVPKWENNLSKSLQTVVEKNSKLKSGLQKVHSTVGNLYSKYRFFEYKYIELNLFMLILVDDLNKIIELNQNVINARIELMKTNFDDELNAFTESIKALDLTTSPEAIEAADKLSKQSKLKLQIVYDNIQKEVNKASQDRGALIDVIKDLLKRDQQLLSTVREHVNNVNTAKANARS